MADTSSSCPWTGERRSYFSARMRRVGAQDGADSVFQPNIGEPRRSQSPVNPARFI